MAPAPPGIISHGSTTRPRTILPVLGLCFLVVFSLQNVLRDARLHDHRKVLFGAQGVGGAAPVVAGGGPGPPGGSGAARPITGTRTAVCVVGQIRTLYSSTQLEAVRKVMRSLEREGGFVDVFLVLGEQPELLASLRKAEKKPNNLKGFRAVSREEIVTTLVGNGSVGEGGAPDPVQSRTFFYTGEEYRKTPRGACGKQGDTGNRYYDWQAAYWPLQHCLSLLQKSESFSKKRYSFVLKLRPDMRLAYPLRLSDFPALVRASAQKPPKPLVAANAFSYHACIFCDHWALMTRPAADAFFTVTKVSMLGS